MLQVIIPGAVIVLAAISYGRIRNRDNRRAAAMTPQRKALYEAALQSLTDPFELRRLAAAFEGQGLEEEADVLNKRAKLRELTPDIQEKRRKAFRMAMSCKDPDKVLEFADAFSECACFSAANNLRVYASGLFSEDVKVIEDIIKALESTSSKAPESGKLRSLGTRDAISNLNERIETLKQSQ